MPVDKIQYSHAGFKLTHKLPHTLKYSYIDAMMQSGVPVVVIVLITIVLPDRLLGKTSYFKTLNFLQRFLFSK